MGGIVNVLGIPVNVVTERELSGLMKSYISNDYMNITYMISVGTCQVLSEKPELIEGMKQADLILPGEKIILSKSHTHKIRGVANSYRYFLYMLRNKDLFKKIFVIGKTEKETLQITEIFKNQNSVVEVCGTYSMDSGINDEAVINEINGTVPDVLVIALDSPDLEEWIEEHKLKVYAKLCVGIGDISDTIIKENAKLGKWVVRLGLENLYFERIKRKYSESRKQERILRTLLADYNSKRK